jgi:hypothetical protein
MNVLLLALTLAATVVAADRREIVGTLTIGADTYTVAGTIAEDGAKETKLSLILSHGGKTEHRIEVVLGGVSSAILDGVAVPIPSALAAEWRDQLKASKTPDTSQFVCTRDRNELNCDTRTVSEFAQGLFGTGLQVRDCVEACDFVDDRRHGGWCRCVYRLRHGRFSWSTTQPLRAPRREEHLGFERGRPNA